jgi:hypothetical protein
MYGVCGSGRRCSCEVNEVRLEEMRRRDTGVAREVHGEVQP